MGESWLFADYDEEKALRLLPVFRKNLTWQCPTLTVLRALTIVGLMNRNGVLLPAGTDAPMPYCFAGFSLHDELELLVKAGLSPHEALKSATLNPALYFGSSADHGTVEVGKMADLVLLDADPLLDIGNTRRINAVIFDGKFYNKATLKAMVVSP